MLILFDIDLTLITTDGAGMAAMGDAGRALFGPGFATEGVEFAGRLDPLIMADLLRVSGVPVTRANLAAMRAAYGEHLARRLAEPGRCRALPGVPALLDELERRSAVLGLLTGNFAETGQMKLRASGIDPGRFRLRVWGDESPHDPPSRDHLPAIGLERYGGLVGGRADPARVAVVGDTPHDIACALSHGCRPIGVATGRHTREQLERAGAEHVFTDLSRTEEVVGVLLGARRIAPFS